MHRYYGNSPIGELSATCKFMGVVEALQGQVPSSFLPVTVPEGPKALEEDWERSGSGAPDLPNG